MATDLDWFRLTGQLTAIVADYIDADTHPDPRAVSALVDIIPRLTKGTILWCPTITPPRGVVPAPIRARFDATDGRLRTIATQARNERQHIAVTGAATYTLTFPLAGGDTTGPIPTNATPFAVETALAALTNIGRGNVTVTGNASNYNVYFIGRLSGQDVPLRTADRTGITITEDLKGDGRDGVELLACSDALPIDELIYDLVFHKIRYNGADQYLQPFAIKAPPGPGEIDLATVERLPPLPGIQPFR